MYCMAAIPKLAKRVFTHQIWRSNSASIPPAASSLLLNFRTAHTSTYDKNDEDLSQNVVIDDVNQTKAEKYWAPHPKTGVFGPVTEQSSEGASSFSAADVDKESILEEKAWFRPTSIEDPERPH